MSKTRTYEINGKKMPSITSITGILAKPALVNWAIKQTIDYIDKHKSTTNNWNMLLKKASKHIYNVSKSSTDIGTEVHNRINEYIITGGLLSTYDEPKSRYVFNAYNAFLQWANDYVDDFIETEQTIYSERYSVAGTLDAIVLLKSGKNYLVDFKTSNDIYDEYALQLAAYAYIRAEEKQTYADVAIRSDGNERLKLPDKPFKVDGIGIVRLDKITGKYEWKDFSDKMDDYIDAFIKLADFYTAWRGINKRH